MASGIRTRSRRGWWVAVGCLLLALAGVGLFALAFRPCRFAVEPGQILAWDLTVRSVPLAEDGSLGAERSASHRLVLVGLGPEPGTTAWLAGQPQPAQALLVDVPRDGRVRLLGADGRPTGLGPALAGFDFNLLPLPLGAEQEWKPDVVWATLPEGSRSVTATVKRLRSGAFPQFRCEFPLSVEWVDPVTGRYRQVRQLVSTYRFDTLRHRPREAVITFTLREEQAPPNGFTARRITLTLAFVGAERSGEPAQLRTQAAAAVAAEGWVARRQSPPDELLAPLRTIDGPFRGLADGLLARLGSGR